MKYILPVFLAILCLACNKDKVPEVHDDQANYYQSSGNLLALVIEDNLYSAYEYNLTTTGLINDSLPLQINSEPYIMDYINYWKYSPNPDTLFWSNAYDFTFNESRIDKDSLQKLFVPVPLDTSLFQNINTPQDINYSEIWGKISNLSIVRNYRHASPQSRIGITRTVIGELDEDLGFSMPKEMHIVFMVK